MLLNSGFLSQSWYVLKSVFEVSLLITHRFNFSGTENEDGSRMRLIYVYFVCGIRASII